MTEAGTDVLLIVIELFRDCHVAFGFDRSTFGEFILFVVSLSDVGRPKVLYCGPVDDGGIGLSVMLLLRFVFVDGVGMLNGRLFSDKLVADFVIVAFVANPALVASFDGTFTGVTVTDEFMILRGNVGDDAAEVDDVECDAFFDVTCCGALGEVRRWFCCCRTGKEEECEIIRIIYFCSKINSFENTFVDGSKCCHWRFNWSHFTRGSCRIFRAYRIQLILCRWLDCH